MASFGPIKQAIFDKEARKQQYQAHIKGLNAYDRHKKFLDDYGVLKYMSDEQSPSLRWKGCYNCSYSIFDLIDQMTFYGKENSAKEKLPIKTDQDTLREGYRFIRTEEDDLNPSWEQRLVKRYYDKLFKEYCIADMSHYKTGKIGLRWRTEKEVISGKGQFICGNKHCNERDGLASYEVNFSYSEAGENKQALVKLVTCERCAEKLVYKRQKEKEKEKERQKQKEALRRKRERSETDDDTDSESDRRKDRRKGKKASSSAIDHKKDDDENFDEYLEGMFP